MTSFLEKIRSKYILIIILNNLKIKRRLKFFQYNKKIMNKININMIDFRALYLVDKLNEDFKTSYNDHLIDEIDFSDNPDKATDFLKNMSCIYFKSLKSLILDENDMLILNEYLFAENYLNLRLLYCPGLEKLSLFNNRVISLGFLKNINFVLLKELDLSCNYIDSIEVLAYCNLPNLIDLDLSYNYIEKISVFDIVNFNYLEYLNLKKNQITNCSVNFNKKFPCLKKFYFDNNLIIDYN